MKSISLLILSISFVLSTSAQDEVLSSMKKDVAGLHKEITSVKEENKKLNSSLSLLATLVKVQNDSILKLRSFLINTNDDLVQRISKLQNNVDANSTQSNTKITALDESLSKNTLYWIIAFLIAGLISILIYYLLRKRIKSESDGVTEKIANTKKVLEEEGVKLDNKLIAILESQLKLMHEDIKINKETSADKSEVPDHSLALKVADEIIRIQTNISNMDPETKGLKQLAASVKRIQDNFEANGYDLIEMLNKPFDQGMNVVANFRPDENLKPGEQIITRIIKPQVNFKGIMILAAQIEVSQGE